MFGEFGKQGTGYSIPFLIEQVQTILNLNRQWDVALIGAGDLGHAIIRYRGFATSGFHIVLAFDKDPEKVGRKLGDLIIQGIEDMEQQIRAANVQVAMLTVPASEAQETADTLIRAGVRAILNYAPITLSVPEGVHVESVEPILQLQHMAYYL